MLKDIKHRKKGGPAFSNGSFAMLCLGGYLLSMSYGTTFLISLLVKSHGGNESSAGTVVCVAMISTIVAVVVSGHLLDIFGPARSVAMSGLLLCIACVGLATAPAQGSTLLLSGLVLGFGWGVFYTLGPIMISTLVPCDRRAAYFAILSGSMMSGIGTGPLVGRVAAFLGYPLEAAFYVASATSLLGGLIFEALHATTAAAPASGSTASSSRISRDTVFRVLGSRAAFPTVMVGLGGCVFGGLSTFQTSYAALHKLDYADFFLGFVSAAVACRLLVSGIVVKRDPYITSCIFSGLIVASILMFAFAVNNQVTYLIAAMTLGVGYGLTYSIINGLAASESPSGCTAQALLIFSLSYFIGTFGFPLLASRVIISFGVAPFIFIVLAIAIVNWLVAVARLVWRSPARIERC